MTTLTLIEATQLKWTCGPDDGSNAGPWHQEPRILTQDGKGWRETIVPQHATGTTKERANG